MRVFLVVLLLSVAVFGEPWTLTYELRLSQGSIPIGRQVKYHSTGEVESVQHQGGEGPSTSSGHGQLEKPRLQILEKAVMDPEILRQKSFGPGRINLVVQKGGVTRSFGANDVKQFPGASGRLLRAVLKAQGEPGY